MLKPRKIIKKWIQKYLEEIGKLRLKGQEDLEKYPVFLVYTNKVCDEINREVRNNLFENTEEKYIPGEIIIFNNYYYHKKSDTKYYTSQKMVVSQVSEKIYIFNFSLKLLEKLDSIFAKFMRDNTQHDIDMLSYQEDCQNRLDKIISILYQLEVPYYELMVGDSKPIWVLHPTMESKFPLLLDKLRDDLQKFKKYNQRKYGKTPDIKKLIDTFMTCIWEEFYEEVLDVFLRILVMVIVLP